jgi:hypothetical protein
LQDQWQRKKQTKEQKRQAKRAKLDPANQKSAKDVMDENERKRKRELGVDDDEQVDVPAKTVQQPTKKQKVEDEDDADSADDDDDDNEQDANTTSSSKKAQADKRKEKRRLKKEKADKQKQKLDAKKAARKQDTTTTESAADEEMKDADDQSADEAADDAMDFSGLVDNDETSTPSSPDQSDPVFDTSANQSATSSSSSIVPNSESAVAEEPTKAKKALALKLPEVNAEELQARLKARIEALRAQRKADGPNGAAPRNRQELLESRRKKEEARKQNKKELRLKAKQEEERLNNERLHGSGSPLATPDIFSPRVVDENSFSFGRVAFAGDEETDPTLTSISAHKKKKGPSDIKTAIAAAEKKAQRLAGMDEDKRKEIEEKDMWLNAKKRAHGERVKDDQSLLKKTLKRKTDQKTKSATQWNERLDNVKKGKEMKDKKRTENLNKRRDEKGTKKGGKKGSSSGGAKKKARPGFEGRFKA